MNKDFLSKLNHDLSYRPGIIREALERGVEFGTKEFFVYSQLRWYETDGKFGYCVAGNSKLGEDVGLTEKEVEYALRGLNDAGLVEHVWCDRKVYRNKTKLWISTARLAGVCTNVDAIRVLNKGRKNIAVLGKTTSGNVETTSGNVETTSGNVGATPVITEVGNTNRNTNINIIAPQPTAATQTSKKKEVILYDVVSSLVSLIGVSEPRSVTEIKRANKDYGIARRAYSDDELIMAAKAMASSEPQYRTLKSLFYNTAFWLGRAKSEGKGDTISW